MRGQYLAAVRSAASCAMEDCKFCRTTHKVGYMCPEKKHAEALRETWLGEEYGCADTSAECIVISLADLSQLVQERDDARDAFDALLHHAYGDDTAEGIVLALEYWKRKGDFPDV